MDQLDSTDSPYAPPQATLADIEPATAPTPRPWQVSRAVTCLWISWVIGLARALWNFLQPPRVVLYGPIQPEPTAPMIVLGAYALGALLAIWIYTSVAKGRNWARILVLIMTGFSIINIPSVYHAVKLGIINPMVAASGVLNYGINFYICYLLLTGPANAWFRSMKRRS